MLGRPLLETLASLAPSCRRAGGQVETTARRKDGHELEVALTLVPVSMSQSLEFNGFLEALEIVAPRGNALAQLQQSHHTVVEWIHAAVAGRARVEEDGLSAGTIVAFRAVGAPPPPLPSDEPAPRATAAAWRLVEASSRGALRGHRAGARADGGRAWPRRAPTPGRPGRRRPRRAPGWPSSSRRARG